MDVWWKRSMLLTYNRNQLSAVRLLYTLLLVCCGYPTWVLVNSVSAAPMTRIASEYDHTSCLSALWNTPRKSIPPFSLLYHHSDSNFEWHAADLILIHSTSEEVLQQEDSIVHKFEIPPQHPTPVSIICSEICYRLVLDNRWKSTDLLTGISHNVCFCIDRNVHIIKLKPQNSIQKLADAVGSQLESEIDIYEVVTECPLDISDCGTSYMSSAITTEEWRRGPTLHSPSSNACQVVPWTKTGQLCCIPSHMIDNVSLVIQHTQNKNRSLMNTILIHSIIVILIFCFGELLLYFYLRNRNIWGTQIALAHASSEAMLTAEDIAAADNVGEHLVELLPRRGQSLFESCDDSVCPICLALLVEQECLRFPVCGHTLHSECAKSLISHGARRLQDIVCPLCRVTVATLVSREETELPSEASPVNGAESAISAVSNQEETQEGGTSYLNVAEETQEHDTERNNETCELVSSDPRTTDPQPTNEDENEVKDAKEQNSEALA